MTEREMILTPAEAASTLGVSKKALRVYEERGLITPLRTAAGWRAYGPEQMRVAAQVATLRALGLSLAQIARVQGGDPQGLEQALAAHQGALEEELRNISGRIARVRHLRDRLATGEAPGSADIAALGAQGTAPAIAFDLPWPWGGERFELRDIRRVNYIIGPLFSGKTRLARHLAKALPDGRFLGIERVEGDCAEGLATLAADPALTARVERALAWLVEDGAAPSPALRVLLAGLEAQAPGPLVIDMIEQGLDEPSQLAIAAYLRAKASRARPLFVLTRSSAILDMAALGPEETVLLCPANHSPPVQVAPCPGSPGYETVQSCLGSPEVRARTQGVIATRVGAA
ncbi:MerR family transcriptional regulator [Rhodobacteraceae bacterium NNCM2]|nr:MerR family transcriptional regulator [Coraliihabitans acroporae]